MLEDPLNLVGTTVSDKYEIERVVGEGGFALVYRAMHRVWKRPVSISTALENRVTLLRYDGKEHSTRAIK